MNLMKQSTNKGGNMQLEQQALEPFMDADAAAEFLSMNRLRVIRDARSGRLPAHPYRRGRGNDWFFLRSELARHMKGEVESTPRPFAVGKAQ